VAEPLELTVEPSVAWFPNQRSGEGMRFTYRIVNRYRHKSAGRIDVAAPAGWWVEDASFAAGTEDEVVRGTIMVKSRENEAPGFYPLRFQAGSAFFPVAAKVFHIPAITQIHLGIVKSYDNTLEWGAEALNVSYEMLDSQYLTSGNLNKFTSIIIDIRAYAVREDLRQNNHRLLDYVRNGGNLIVMYQKTQDWKAEYAPYPISIGRGRVTEEKAEVRILSPGHPLMNSPNRILKEDWDGWVQERGIYFASEASPEYERILSTGDAGESPLDSGLLAAAYGRGSYIYTSLVWYRQMKEAHQGALKCFANMISYHTFRQ
jgi:hypothetical protein